MKRLGQLTHLFPLRTAASLCTVPPKTRPVFAEEEAAAEEAPAEAEAEAPAPAPAPKLTAVEYLDTMYGGIGPENGKILGTGYPPAAIAIAKLGTPATLDFMR